MKKIVCFLCILFIFLCSGCSNIKYSLSFGNNIVETINVKDEAHVLENVSDNYMTGMSSFEYLFQSQPYTSGSDINGNYYATKKHNNMNDLINDSIVFQKYVFGNCVSINGKKVQIDISSSNINLELYKNLDSFEVSLYIPYYVKSHNADIVENNKYIWTIDDIETDSIKINFDLSKSTNYKYTIISTIIVGIVIVCIIGIIIYFVYKNRKANEI